MVEETLHSSTKALQSTIPLVNEEIELEKVHLKGEIEDPANPPKCCRLHPRCPFMYEKCSKEEPLFIRVREERYVKCWLYASL
ncbi:MAG: hypothetical protein QW764_01720 [Desulfurococcaceae archaeon]